MTFRRLFLVAAAVFLGALIWHLKDLETGAAVAMASTALWCLVVVLMLPSERFNPQQLINIVRTWKGKDSESE